MSTDNLSPVPQHRQSMSRVAPRRLWRVTAQVPRHDDHGRVALLEVVTTVPAASADEAILIAGATPGATAVDTGDLVGVWRVDGVEVWARDEVEASIVAGSGCAEGEPITPVWRILSGGVELQVISYDRGDIESLAAGLEGDIEVVRR